MRLISLSDHAGDELARARQERQAALARKQEQYQREVTAFHRSLADAREQRDRSWRQHRPLSWLRCALAVRRLRRAPQPRPPAPLPPDRAEGAREGGVHGEQEVADVLGPALDDAWVLVKGYSNLRGEIDYLLLGPGGLLAVEVKYVNGTFTITRDRWAYVKYDNYGNPVERAVLTDHGRNRRPPNLQLSEPLHLLERFLERFGQPVRSHPVVLLNHPKARIERCADDIGVEVLTSTGQLLRLAQSSEAAVSANRVAQIERLIIRDHNHYAERSRQAGGGMRAPSAGP